MRYFVDFLETKDAGSISEKERVNAHEALLLLEKLAKKGTVEARLITRVGAMTSVPSENFKVRKEHKNSVVFLDGKGRYVGQLFKEDIDVTFLEMFLSSEADDVIVTVDFSSLEDFGHLKIDAQLPNREAVIKAIEEYAADEKGRDEFIKAIGLI